MCGPFGRSPKPKGNLLDRTRLLIVSMIVLILALTALCVLATMAALAMERREDVGLDEGARRLDFAHCGDYSWPRWACSARPAG